MSEVTCQNRSSGHADARQYRTRRGLLCAASLVLALSVSGCAGGAATRGADRFPVGPQEIPEPSGLATNPTGEQPITASQASLDQLWALVDSGLRHGTTTAGAVGTPPKDFTDLASAVSSRCVPNLSAAATGHLKALQRAVALRAQRADTDLTGVENAYLVVVKKECR